MVKGINSASDEIWRAFYPSREQIAEILRVHFEGPSATAALDAEKERCALLCEDLARRARENGASGYPMGIACADRIRAAPRG